MGLGLGGGVAFGLGARLSGTQRAGFELQEGESRDRRRAEGIDLTERVASRLETIVLVTRPDAGMLAIRVANVD